MTEIHQCIECTGFITDAEAAKHLRNLSAQSQITVNIIFASSIAVQSNNKDPNQGTRKCQGQDQYDVSVECFNPDKFVPRPAPVVASS